MPLVGGHSRHEDQRERRPATVAGYAGRDGQDADHRQGLSGVSLVNRILTAYVVGFLRLIRDGADFEAGPTGQWKNFGWPMGPAYLQDVIGMDTSKPM